MARIDYALPPTRDPNTQVPMLNLMRMMAHYPGGNVWAAVGGQVIRNGLLDPIVREVVILRTGRLAGSDYEVVQHQAFGKAVGMTPEQIDSAEHGRTDGLSATEQLALRMTEDVFADGAISPGTFAEAQTSFNVPEIIEVLITIAFYRGTATFLRSFDVDLDEDGAAGAKAAILGAKV